MKLKFVFVAFVVVSMMVVFTFREVFRMFGLVREKAV